MTKRKRSWILFSLLTGATYTFIGLSFTVFGGWSGSNRGIVAWRIASFVASLIVFATHIGFEHFTLANRPVAVALHAATGVGLGAFGTAVAANIHAIGVADANHRNLAISLVVWPLMTGIPAFMVALIGALALRWWRPAR